MPICQLTEVNLAHQATENVNSKMLVVRLKAGTRTQFIAVNRGDLGKLWGKKYKLDNFHGKKSIFMMLFFPRPNGSVSD